MIVPLHTLMVAVVLAPVPQAAPPGFVMWSASELAQRDAALSTRVGPDHSARETLADYGERDDAGGHCLAGVEPVREPGGPVDQPLLG